MNELKNNNLEDLDLLKKETRKLMHVNKDTFTGAIQTIQSIKISLEAQG